MRSATALKRTETQATAASEGGGSSLRMAARVSFGSAIRGLFVILRELSCGGKSHEREHARAGPISDGESPGKWVGCDVGERKIDGATLAYFLEQALIEIKG